MKKHNRTSPPYYFFGKDYLSDLLKSKRKIALFLDFDGTLVPIQKNPSKCTLSHKLKRHLELMRDSKNCYLTILSGRSLKDIKQRIDIKKIYYGGNHGLDISGPNLRYKHPKAVSVKKVINQIRQKLKEEIKDIDGAWLEDKKFTFSLHFRSVKTEDILRLEKIFNNVVNKYSDKKLLSVIKGKKVLELLPDMTWDKGKAVLWFLQRFNDKCLPIYVGDDKTDETAFKALYLKGVTVRIGKSKRSSAVYYLKGYWEITKFLKQVYEFIEK
ncbi:MAG: trehalose-phosphatase [Thermodesulfovibrionales bacterium]